jgi:hypothetical protein
MSYYIGPKDALMRLVDETGVERACLVDIICRGYGRTQIREYHYGWVGEKYANGSVQIAPTTPHYIREDTTDPWYPSTPRAGGRFEDMSDYFVFTIYFDDLILRRASGRFEIREQADHPFDYLRTDARVAELIERRRHVPEFYIE